MSGDTNERYIGGFDVNYRLTGKPENDKQLWFFMETFHGVRSADVDCSAEESKRPPVCSSDDVDLSKYTNAKKGDELRYILRNASSFEGFAGFRYEFRRLQAGTASPVSLYLKGQLGLMAIAKGPGDAVDNHFLGMGMMATAGRFEGSYFDAGWGQIGRAHV